MYTLLLSCKLSPGQHSLLIMYYIIFLLPSHHLQCLINTIKQCVFVKCSSNCCICELQPVCDVLFESFVLIKLLCSWSIKPINLFVLQPQFHNERDRVTCLRLKKKFSVIFYFAFKQLLKQATFDFHVHKFCVTVSTLFWIFLKSGQLKWGHLIYALWFFFFNGFNGDLWRKQYFYTHQEPPNCCFSSQLP